MAVEPAPVAKLLHASGGIAFWDVGPESPHQYQLVYYAPVPDETEAYDAFMVLAWNVFSKGLASAAIAEPDSVSPLPRLISYLRGFGLKLGGNSLSEPADALLVAQSLRGPGLDKRGEAFQHAHRAAVTDREQGIFPRSASPSGTPDETLLKHALALSVALRSRQADITTWQKLLALRSESANARIEKIMARAESARAHAQETLDVFLAQNGISLRQLEERCPASSAGANALDSPTPVAIDPTRYLLAPAAYSVAALKQDWQSIANHVPGLIASPVLKRALALADALEAAEARLPRRSSARARRRHAIARRWARWKRNWAIAAHNAAERNLYDYLDQSGMYSRVRLARDYLLEAWKLTLAEDIAVDKAPPFLDAAGALAARVRAYLDQWARECATKPASARPAG